MSVAWLWTLVSLVGLVLSLWLARDSYRDLRALRRAGVTNGRIMLARIWLAIDLLFATAHGAFFGLGLTILEREIDLSWTVVILVYGNVVMMTGSILNATLRHLLYATRNGEPRIPTPDGDA